jgi:hypothetical protein
VTYEVRGYNALERLEFRAVVIDHHSFNGIGVAEFQPLMFKHLTEHEQAAYVPVEPAIQWPFELAEAVFQAMWTAGYRPKNGSSGVAEVDALKNHIAFAEKVTNKLLRIAP